MKIKEWKEILPIIQAFVDGKEIQYKSVSTDEWRKIDASKLDFTRGIEYYRIKPAPREYLIATCAENVWVTGTRLFTNPNIKVIKVREVTE